jgi:hypothetical protein
MFIEIFNSMIHIIIIIIIINCSLFSYSHDTIPQKKKYDHTLIIQTLVPYCIIHNWK